MVATTRKSWSTARPSTPKAAGKWKKSAPLEGGVFQHPNGKFVARKLGMTDTSFDTHEAAQAHVNHWNDSIAKFKAEQEQHRKKFSEV